MPLNQYTQHKLSETTFLKGGVGFFSLFTAKRDGENSSTARRHYATQLRRPRSGRAGGGIGQKAKGFLLHHRHDGRKKDTTAVRTHNG